MHMHMSTYLCMQYLVQVSMCKWNILYVHVCMHILPESHYAGVYTHPYVYSASKPFLLSPCLPRISRGTNAILKSKTYDPFCSCSFQSPNRVQLIKFDFIKKNLMPKGLLQQTLIHVSRPIDFTVMQRLDFFFFFQDWTLHANAESSGGGNMSKEIQAKERGGKRWEAGKIMQSFGSNCSAKCA